MVKIAHSLARIFSEKKQKYSLDVKLSVIQAVKNGQYSAEQVAIHFGIQFPLEMLLPMVGRNVVLSFTILVRKSIKMPNYNDERIQVKLKGLSPIEYRTQYLN